MPLATLTRTIAAPPASDTPVVANPTPAMSRAGGQLMVWITGSSTPAGNEYIGSYQYVTPAGSGDGWLFDGPFNTLRLRGAVVDPDPVDGRTYRVLGTGSEASYLVRYNDEDHRGDRHRAGNPWSIIGGSGTSTHPFPTDTPVEGYVERCHYIEVEAREGDDRSSAEVTEEDLIAAPGQIANLANGPTRGLAVTGDDGLVEVNPERVVSRTYLVWSGTETLDALGPLKLAVFTGPADPADNTAGFVSEGYLHTFTGDVSDLGHRTTEQTLPGHEQIRWAELALLPAPEPTAHERVDSQGKAAALRSEARALEVSFSEFNEALNELAKDKGWCSEYEDIVTDIGMTGRNRKYDVEVSVDFSFEIDSTSSRLDTAIENDIGMGINVSSVRVTGSTTVTVNSVECEGDTDSLSEYISTSDVENALDNLLANVDSIEIDDWSVEDYSESDN
jgi:hypothetical protein